MPTATEPAFLAERRRKAAGAIQGLPLPGHHFSEEWKRTYLEGFALENYTPSAPKLTLSGAVPKGVIFTDLLTAVAEHPDLVGKYLGTTYPFDQHKLSATQAAHLNGGVFLYVPRGVVLEEPLLAEYHCEGGKAHYLHTVVVADANSAVTLLERYEGEGDYLHVGVTEVFPLQGAQVRFGYLQNHSDDAWSLHFRRGLTGRDSTLEWVAGDFGGGLVRSEMVSNVAGDGSTSTIKSVFGGSGHQHIDMVAHCYHTGNHGYSDILGRGVLAGKAHSVFRGTGEIRFRAKQSSTYQKQQALVLSDKARADSIPALIIDENDVAGAGHAATVGKLDEEQLFYLMARGLSRKQATTMLVMAFLTPVLDQIPLAELREAMTRLMGEKVIR